MANPTAGVPVSTTPYEDNKTIRDLAATAQTYYIGEAIGLNSSGNATKCDDAAALLFDGIAAGYTSGPRVTVDSGDSAGDKFVVAQRPRYAVVSIVETPAKGDEGRPVWWKFSNQVSYFAGTNKNFAGYVRRCPGGVRDAGGLASTQVEIELVPACELVAVNIVYGPTPVDQVNFVADRAYRVVDIRGRVIVGAAGATAQVRKAADTVAIASGTVLHASTFNLNGTADTAQVLTLSSTSADLDVAAGSVVGLDVTGTTTNATGCITVLLAPRLK